MADLKDIAEKMSVKVDDNGNNNSSVAQAEKKAKGMRRRTWLETPVADEVNLVDPADIINWEFHDRPNTELGDIEALAKDFVIVGQQQPCIIRPTPFGSEKKYELIVGERRWRAASLAGVKLKVIIKELTDNEAALSQVAENENRQDLSDYAKGLSYSNLISEGILEQKDLTEKLGKSKQYVSAILSFSKIPDEITSAIGDMSSVSARTAETIKRLSAKGKDYVDAIVRKAPELKAGKLSNKTLPPAIDKLLKRCVEKKNNGSDESMQKVLGNDGRHYFTWRKDNNGSPSIHFPKNILDLSKEEKIKLDVLSDKIVEWLQDELNKIK